MPAKELRQPWNKGYISHLACLSPDCSRTYSLEQIYRHSKTIFVNSPPTDLEGACSCMAPLDVRYKMDDLAAILNPHLLSQRYDEELTFLYLPELLPFNSINVGRHVRFSPMMRAKNIEAHLKTEHGVDLRLYLKLDSELPTGSFKDRPTIAAFNAALEAGGYTATITSSTGNLGISTMQYAKDHDISCLLFIPHTIRDGKLTPMRVNTTHPEYLLQVSKWKFGMQSAPEAVNEYALSMLNDKRRQLIRFEGNYDQANAFAGDVARKTNELSTEKLGRDIVFIPNDTFRVFYKEGSKTQGWEIVAQLLHKFGEANSVIKMITPTGSGALGCSSAKGIQELLDLKLSDYRVVSFSAQGEGCSPVVDALINGASDYVPVREPATIAKSIAIGRPGSGHQLMDVVRKTGGAGLKVPEKEVLNNMLRLFELEGIASQFVGGVSLGAVYEGVKKDHFVNGDAVVVNITGHGKRIMDDVIPDAKKLSSEGNDFIGRAQKLVDKLSHFN